MSVLTATLFASVMKYSEKVVSCSDSEWQFGEQNWNWAFKIPIPNDYSNLRTFRTQKTQDNIRISKIWSRSCAFNKIQVRIAWNRVDESNQFDFSSRITTIFSEIDSMLEVTLTTNYELNSIQINMCVWFEGMRWCKTITSHMNGMKWNGMQCNHKRQICWCT